MKKNKIKESEYEKQLNFKIEERLTSMESADYSFILAPHFGQALLSR